MRALGIGVAFILGMTGCSGSSTSTGTGSLSGDAGSHDPGSPIGHGPKAGSGDDPGGTPTPAPGGNGDACSPSGDDDACLSCTKDSCCSAFAGCVRDEPCAALFTCAAHCANGDDTCVKGCLQTHAAGLDHARALVQCQERSCAASCGGGAPNDQCLPDDAMAGANDCDNVAGKPKVRDCPGGSPGAECVLAPDGAANVYCCPL